MEGAQGPSPCHPAGPPPPYIAVTSDRSSGYFQQYGFADSRPISMCSIESNLSFVCSEASSWTSGDFDDEEHLLSAVHRLSMSSASSWTVSELGDDEDGDNFGISSEGDICSQADMDALMADSLLTLACYNSETGVDGSMPSKETGESTSDSGEGMSSANSVVMADECRDSCEDEVETTPSSTKRQSVLLDDSDGDIQISLDVTTDDVRVSHAILIQQDSTLVAMSEARILRLPMRGMTLGPSSSLIPPRPFVGCTGSKTLNRLGTIPDVAAVNTSSPPTNRRRVAYLNFWEMITRNSVKSGDMKRRSMLY